MLHFFPNPYPDETLYSLLARYNMYSGNKKSKHTIEDLYGDITKKSFSEFATGLEILLSRIPIELTPDEIIYNHTTFPFFSAFIPLERVKEIEEKMIKGTGQGINTTIGINSSSIVNFRLLKHCRICMNEDIDQYGETYWHRVHQLPGVLVCPSHKHPLTVLKKQIYDLKDQEYLLASTDLIDFANEPKYSDEQIEFLFSFSKEAQWILNNKIIMPDYDFYRDKYLTLLKGRKIASNNGRVDQKNWLSLFSNSYDKKLLDLMQSDISVQNDSWINSIVRKHRKAFHPIRHILVIMLLTKDLQSFYEFDRSFLPFGKGPWPCLNPAHNNNYRRKVIREVRITTCTKTKRPVGSFKCSCGFEYSRKGPDSEMNDLYKRGRIKSFGHIWIDKLKLLIKQELSIRKIALKLGVDSKTIKNQLSLLDNSNEKIKMIDNSILNKKRQIWKSLIHNNPDLAVTQLRQWNNAVYMWLYRNDKQWLTENSPKIGIKVSNNQRVDWKLRDNILLTEVMEIIKRWHEYEEDRPVKITKTRIAKKSLRPHLILDDQKNVPNTIQYINKVIETDENFRLRRIDWAKEKLIQEGEQLSKWTLLRKAAIRSDFINNKIIEHIYSKL